MSDERLYPPEHPALQVQLHVMAARGMPIERTRVDAEFRYNPESSRYELHSVGDRLVVDSALLGALTYAAGLGLDALWDEHREEDARMVGAVLDRVATRYDVGRRLGGER